jgi:hypothetical protein
MSGRLGTVEAGNGSFVSLYSAPLSVAVTTANLLVANTNSSPVNFSAAIATSASPTTAQFIVHNFEIPANGILRESALVISAGEIVLVSANAPGVACRLHGYQKG